MENKFEGFPKMPRFSRDVVITEKIDGTNGQVFLFTEEEAIMFGVDWVEKYSTRVTDELFMAVGSRKRYILPNDDNYGFARWCWDNHKELAELGPGRHFGE